MAVSIFFRYLLDVFVPRLKHTKLLGHRANNKVFKRNFSEKRLYRKSSGSLVYKINLAQFYNGCKPFYNASTYETLVKQKSSEECERDSKKSTENKDFPGRHKFHKEVEAALNDQIEIEFNACFTYLSMASYYGRSEVALPGCQGFFMNMHQEEHEHAIIFLNYILMRGGHVRVPTVKPPDNLEWKDVSKTFETAVQLESEVKEKLEELVELSEKHCDHQLADFISGDFLEEQNKSIQTLSRLFARSKMVNNAVGEFLFDQHLFQSFVKSKHNLMFTTNLPEESDDKVYK